MKRFRMRALTLPSPFGRGLTIQPESKDEMSDVAYVSEVHITRQKGPMRIARLPGESNPVTFSVHGAIAKHYGIDEANLPESHAATLDYIVAATGG